MRLLSIALAAGLGALSISPVLAEQELEGHRVAYEIVGNTLKGVYRDCGPRMDFFEHYKPNGEIHGKERACNMAGNWTTYVGKWEVRDGRFCTAFSSDRHSGCYSYTTVPGGLKRTGEMVMEDELQILEGNPENL